MPIGAAPRTAKELGLMEGFPPAEDKLVTVANFQDAPYNRWAFLHMSNLLPTAGISRGDLPITMFPREIEDVGGLSYEGPDGTTTVAEMLERTYTDGFLVVRDGVV